MVKNIFEQIRDGESPAEIVFRNEYVTAFQDLYPRQKGRENSDKNVKNKS